MVIYHAASLPARVPFLATFPKPKRIYISLKLRYNLDMDKIRILIADDHAIVRRSRRHRDAQAPLENLTPSA